MRITHQGMLMLLLAVCALAPAQEAPSFPGKGLPPVTAREIQPLIALCETCHGPKGQSTRQDVPVIAGKPADSIMDSLEQFYFYERHCPDVQYKNESGSTVTQSMCDITSGLTKPEVQALARFFEGRDPESRDAAQ